MAHPKGTKAAAMADLASGVAVMAVADKYNVSYKTVFRWAQELPLAVRQSASYETKKEHIGDLVIALLETNLVVATKILTTVGNDTEWIKKQSASDLGIFYGIITDKTATIASILTAASQPALSAPEQAETDPYEDSNVSRIIEQDPNGY